MSEITQEQIQRFQDRYGIIHHEKVLFGDPLTSENGPLFTGTFARLNYFDPSLLCRILSLLEYKRGHYKPTPASLPGDHFSLDNVLGILLIKEAIGEYVTDRKDFPRQTGFFTHPRDILFRELYLRPKASRWLFRIWAKSSMDEPRKDTSTKILWWLRYKLLGLDTKELEDLLVKEHGPNPMKDVFSIYFKDPEHPINLYFKDNT